MRKILGILFVLSFCSNAFALNSVTFTNETKYFAMGYQGGTLRPEIYPHSGRVYSFHDLAQICVGKNPCQIYVQVYGSGLKQPVTIGLFTAELNYATSQIKVFGVSDQFKKEAKFVSGSENVLEIKERK